jgi:hypothetical protein
MKGFALVGIATIFLGVVTVAVVESGSPCTGAFGCAEYFDESDSEDGDAIEISVTGEATVGDLRDVLVEWESLKQAVVDYAKHEKSGYLKNCPVQSLTIEHLRGIGRYEDKLVKEMFPKIYSSIGERGVQIVHTQHPCFMNDKNRTISWVINYRSGKHNVISDLTVL